MKFISVVTRPNISWCQYFVVRYYTRSSRNISIVAGLVKPLIFHSKLNATSVFLSISVRIEVHFFFNAQPNHWFVIVQLFIHFCLIVTVHFQYFIPIKLKLQDAEHYICQRNSFIISVSLIPVYFYRLTDEFLFCRLFYQAWSKIFSEIRWESLAFYFHWVGLSCCELILNLFQITKTILAVLIFIKIGSARREVFITDVSWLWFP